MGRLSLAGLAALKLLLAVPVAAAPSTDAAARLRMAEAWLGTQLARDGVVGASAAVVHGEETIWAKGFGHANAEARVPATPDTRYSVCSISKLFTSMLAMQERDAGRLDIDAPVETILPWARLAPAEGQDGPVTARAIMSHVAGLPREIDLPYWSEARFPDRAAIEARVPGQAMLYRGFDNFQYSNLGITLLGEMAAKTAGQPFAPLVTARILAPLGLSRTTPEIPIALRGKELAIGYTSRRTGWAREPFPPYTLNGVAPAAGFASTANDLARFASWQFRLLRQGGEEVLKASTLREMQRTHWVAPDRPDQAWGLGFAIISHGGKTFVGHGGWCPGYRSQLMMRLPDRIAVVVLTNVDDADPGALAREIHDLVSPALVAGTMEAKRTRDFSAYEGRFGRPRTASDQYLVQLGDELVSLPLFQATGTAKALTRWKPSGEDRFRRVLESGAPGDELRFERDRSGRVVRLWIHSNPMERMGDKA